MKNKSNFMFLILAIVAGIFNGCTKEQLNTETQDQKIEMTIADHAVAGRILNFRSRLDSHKANPALKNTEIVSIDDARLDVETNFNASYAFPNEKYVTTIQEVIEVSMPVTDESYTTVDAMLALYDECFAKVLETYNNSTLENKELVFVNLKEGEIENGELTLDLKVVIGTQELPGHGWTPFVADDNWKYGDYLGKCDGSHYGESDAAEQIEDMLEYYRPIYQVGPPYRIVYVMDENNPYNLEGNEFKDEYENNLMFYIDKTTPLTDDDKCLDYNEMNYHFNGEHTVIYDKMPAAHNKPNNWQCVNWDIKGQTANYTINYQTHYRIRHFSSLIYAYRHIVLIGVIGNPQSLSTL